MIFENDNPEVREKYLTLLSQLDDTQPCANDDPDLWMENWTGRPIPKAVAERLCAGCPFIEACRDYAVTAREEQGIWGGTTSEERLRDER